MDLTLGNKDTLKITKFSPTTTWGWASSPFKIFSKWLQFAVFIPLGRHHSCSIAFDFCKPDWILEIFVLNSKECKFSSTMACSLYPAEDSSWKLHQNYSAGIDHSENLWLTLLQSTHEKKVLNTKHPCRRFNILHSFFLSNRLSH